MSTKKKLTEEETYEDNAPLEAIDDALILLARDLSNTVSKLHVRTGEVPHIEIETYGSGYTGEEYSGSAYWRVTTELVQALRDAGHVAGTPRWGYTDQKVLRLTEAAQRTVSTRYKDLQAALATQIAALIERSRLTTDEKECVIAYVTQHWDLRGSLRLRERLRATDPSDVQAIKRLLPSFVFE